MRKVLLSKVLFLLLALSPLSLLAANCPSTETDGTYKGAAYVLYQPDSSCANGIAIVFAHGYVPSGEPADAWKSQLTLPDGTNLPQLLTASGFTFLAEGYSSNGLAVNQYVTDTLNAVDLLPGLKVYVVGASEGALVSTRLLEETTAFKGGISVCGPVGDFRKEVNYLGDIRVLFDYFFPGVIPYGSFDKTRLVLLQAPAAWASLEASIRAKLAANPLVTLQLVSTANIPIGLNLANAQDAVVNAVFYNVYGFLDLTGGSGYDNIQRVYHGSLNDKKLNALVGRYSDPGNLDAFTTSGRLREPMITLHTLLDPSVPYEQETLYKAKANFRLLAQLPGLRYGHCNLSAAEAKLALTLLVAATP